MKLPSQFTPRQEAFEYKDFVREIIVPVSISCLAAIAIGHGVQHLENEATTSEKGDSEPVGSVVGTVKENSFVAGKQIVTLAIGGVEKTAVYECGTSGSMLRTYAYATSRAEGLYSRTEPIVADSAYCADSLLTIEDLYLRKGSKLELPGPAPLPSD